MNPLGYFKWYRRARGGYWAQVTGFIWGTRWYRCKHSQPIPGYNWTFYPWASKAMGNGYMDEWHSIDAHSIIPLSVVTNEALSALKSCLNSKECANFDSATGQELLWSKQAKAVIKKLES